MKLLGLTKVELDALDDKQLEASLAPRKQRASKFHEPDFDAVLVELGKPGKTIAIVYDGYAADAAGLSISTPRQLKIMSRSRFYQKLRAYKKTRRPEFRHTHVPAGACQFDFSGKRPYFTDKNGDQIRVELAVAVLPFSGMTFAIAIRSQSLPDSVHAFVAALEFFRGIPKDAVFDNFKAAVDKPRVGTTPAKINVNFRAMLDHYGMFPDPTRGYRPKDKAMVEKMVQEVQRSFLGRERHLHCHSISELNENLKAALDEINDRPMRSHGGRTRRQIYTEQEFAYLGALPRTRYEFGRWQTDITVPSSYHILYEGAGYSVPFRYIGSKVNIKAAVQTVEIFADGIPIALHQRSFEGTGRQTDPSHGPENHQAMASYKKENIIEFAESLSPTVAHFVTKHIALHKNVKAVGDMLQTLTRKIHLYGRTTVENAISEALERGQVSAIAVYGILERSNVDFQTPLKSPASPSGNVRGPDYYSDGEEQ
jgi:transposase